MSEKASQQSQLPLQETFQLKSTQGDQNAKRTVSSVLSQAQEEIQARRIQVAKQIRQQRKKIEKSLAKIREKTEEKRRLKRDLVKTRSLKNVIPDELVPFIWNE